MATKAVYRPTMDSDTIFELVDLLEQTKRTIGLSTNLRNFLRKLDSLAYDIGKGNRNPAYVATGSKGTGIQNLTVDDLGGYNDSLTEGSNVAASLFGSSSTSNNESVRNPLPAELDSDMEAELERLEKAMLAEVASNGAGSENVILEDRRKTPRIPQETISINDL